jgi:hypothetical protein
VSGMDIATGQQVTGPASTSSEHDPVAPESPRYPSMAAPDAGPVADTVGQQQERLSAGRDAATAAQAVASAAETDRRGGYEATVLPQGGAYGDEMTLPPVVSDFSKHTGGTDATSYDPAG